jgi:hypothetical protein
MSGIIMTSLDVNEALGFSPYDSPELITKGLKTQTRRMVKDGQRFDVVDGKKTVFNPKGSIKWQVGRTYAVVPKRSKPAVWYRFRTGELEFSHLASHDIGSETYDENIVDNGLVRNEALASWGFKQLRVRILDIEKQYLRDITAEDAIAEGIHHENTINPIKSGGNVVGHYITKKYWDYLANEYIELFHVFASLKSYTSLLSLLHGGDQWELNPLVWKLTFEVAS